MQTFYECCRATLGTASGGPDTSIATSMALHKTEKAPREIRPVRLATVADNKRVRQRATCNSQGAVPAAKVDYLAVSILRDAGRDFGGVELQMLDSTGTVRLKRQRLFNVLGIPRVGEGERLKRSFGMNW